MFDEVQSMFTTMQVPRRLMTKRLSEYTRLVRVWWAVSVTPLSLSGVVDCFLNIIVSFNRKSVIFSKYSY